MNTSNIKKYAPKARVEFMDAVTKRLNSFGISQTKGTASKAGELRIAEAVVQGSVLQIDGNSFDSALAEPRRRLVVRSEQLGFEQLVEQEAYTWFNRLCAIRYMEIHDYLGHGFRVLSHPDNPTGFEIIDHAVDAADELDLDRDYIVELKLAGNKDETLYRELLLKQCHKLHQAMPFLFEALNDASELLLPDNLTRTDSILRGLVDGIPEEDWQQVEVIGWLYQFYISDKKDQVMGKVVKSEDIPAATQLFTPNWIVKYLVQNSVGRQWLQTYPESSIKSQMEYYIEPAEQSAEVDEQLQAITPDSIDPVNIKVLDPAVGSGHILIEAYNVLKAIYEERGFRPREFVKLILENNLYGLDIDDRAAQLSGFALMMMARDDDKRIFTRNVRLNVLALQESTHIDLPAQWRALNLSGGCDAGAPQDMFADDAHDLSSFEADNRYQLLQRTLARFTQAKTFGSLIDVPADEYNGLKEMHETLIELAESGDSFQRPAAKQLIDIVHQALILSIRYDAVIANPPYMGVNKMNIATCDYLSRYYSRSVADLYAAFIEKGFSLCKPHGFNSLVTLQTWMFLSSFKDLRENIVASKRIMTLLRIGYNSFPELNSKVVQCVAFIMSNTQVNDNELAPYIDLNKYAKSSNKGKVFFEAKKENIYFLKQLSFKKIPGTILAFHIVEELIKSFEKGERLNKYGVAVKGLDTCNNQRFVRLWTEVSFNRVNTNCKNIEETKHHKYKWYPYSKGGPYRRWYGNYEYLVNWENDGYELKNYKDENGKRKSIPRSVDKYFQKGLTFGAVTSSDFSCRYMEDSIFGGGGNAIFVSNPKYIMGLLHSSIAIEILNALSPSLNMLVSDLLKIPVIKTSNEELVIHNVNELIRLQKEDWDFTEISWGFKHLGLLKTKSALDWNKLRNLDFNRIKGDVQQREYANDMFFRELYGNNSTIVSNLNKVDVDYTSNNFYHFISYSVGCMMGRYSLDQEGLVYAHSGNKGFDSSIYKTFPADGDGIIPLTDNEWFKEDASNRLVEFVKVLWGEDNLHDNLQCISESLCIDAIKPRKSESTTETIRRYLSDRFYKDHLQTYKNRPVYWLFSSGKHKAFECLVYLHRYNEGTLSRMRTEYVTPLLGKFDAYAEQLEKQAETAESTSDSNRFKKELATLAKQQVELREFDDKLKHYADMRISLDLDDGVKVNYGKFGDLLADVKAITGSAPEMK